MKLQDNGKNIFLLESPLHINMYLVGLLNN